MREPRKRKGHGRRVHPERWEHPPLSSWRPEHPHSTGPRFWRHKGGHLFFRFVAVFGLMAVLVLAGMGAAGLLFSRHLWMPERAASLARLGGCGLALLLPLMAVALGVTAFRGIATPLASIMEAAERVAEGDLSVRVPERGPGDFGRLAGSFNRMVAELERADQQRRNLTADVAHELRNPLHIIQGNLEGIIDRVYEPTEGHIHATLEETRLLARLVEDLRTLSLAEAGQLPLQLEQLDVSELLADVCTSFSGQAETAKVELVAQVEGGALDLTITADVSRLDQVLSNLVANALRHTPAGGTIALSAQPRPGGVRVIVRDTGEGIPAVDLPYIFDRFWRGDRARSRSSGTGSGLGLAIARQFVRAHGGRIEAQSEVGHGTAFAVDLPSGSQQRQQQ